MSTTGFRGLVDRLFGGRQTRDTSETQASLERATDTARPTTPSGADARPRLPEIGEAELRDPVGRPRT